VGKLQDHRDDWNITACLAYCAGLSSEILYPETKDLAYLGIADRITGWLASVWGPELRMNFLHPKVNTYHCFMGWLPRALVHRYERGETPEVPGDRSGLGLGADPDALHHWSQRQCRAAADRRDLCGSARLRGL